MREQIQWQQQPYSHNQACLDLIAAKPHGILRILDDQCSFPQVGRCVRACVRACVYFKSPSSRRQNSISRERALALEPERRVARVLKYFVALVN